LSSSRPIPVIDASLTYEPSTEEKVELLAVRKIYSSPDVVDQDYISTKITARATQRFWQTYKVSLEGGYENADYLKFGTGAAGVRSDNFPYGKIELSYSRFKDLELSVYAGLKITNYNLRYSAHAKSKAGSEVLIAPKYIEIPGELDSLLLGLCSN
jgi:hypothetical protein